MFLFVPFKTANLLTKCERTYDVSEKENDWHVFREVYRARLSIKKSPCDLHNNTISLAANRKKEVSDTYYLQALMHTIFSLSLSLLHIYTFDLSSFSHLLCQ